MAVYTPVSASELAGLLADYDLGLPVALLPIQSGVENSNFQLRTTLGRFILTIYERRVDPADLPFFLGLMQHLAERGLPCPLPVLARDGGALRTVCGKPCAIVGFLDGRSVSRVEPAHCRAIGAAMAALHRAAEGFPLRRANALDPAGWRRLVESCHGLAETIETGLDRELGRELAALQGAWPAGLPAGVIHADLFTDNVFFAGSKITGLIDFYFACDDLLAYDLAICLNAWCFEADGSFNVTKSRALVAGYAQVRPLAPAELEALPVLARGAALRFLATRLYDWLHRVEGAIVRPKDPLEYLHKLRFHRQLTSIEAYGIA